MRISKFDDDLWIPISILHLTRATLQEYVDAAAAEARVHGAFDETPELWRNTMAGLALTVLLYLGGEPDVVRVVHPGAKPIKESIRKRDPERFRPDLQGTDHAIRSARSSPGPSSGGRLRTAAMPAHPAGRSVRPQCGEQVRTCTGPGPAMLSRAYRFLLPISVKGGRVVEEPEQPVEGKVS